jgi:hypothetical protein
LSPQNLRTLRALKTPSQIQNFVDAIEYQYADTAMSPQRVLRERKGHCLEGAIVAAAALRVNGYPPLLIDLEAVRDDDHVLAIYRQHGLWGSIASQTSPGSASVRPSTAPCANSRSAMSTTITICAASVPFAPTPAL